MPAISPAQRILRTENGAVPRLRSRYQNSPGCRDLGVATQELRSLLESVVPANVQLEIEAMPCPGETQLTREDLACVLLHRVRRFVSHMPTGGRVRVTAQYGNGFSFLDRSLFPNAQPGNVVITIEESSAKVTDLSADAVPDDIGQRVRAAGVKLRRRLPPGRGMRVELDIPVT